MDSQVTRSLTAAEKNGEPLEEVRDTHRLRLSFASKTQMLPRRGESDSGDDLRQRFGAGMKPRTGSVRASRRMNGVGRRNALLRCDPYGDNFMRMHSNAELMVILERQLPLVTLDGIGLPCANDLKGGKPDRHWPRSSSQIEQSEDGSLSILSRFPSFKEHGGICDLSKAGLHPVQGVRPV